MKVPVQVQLRLWIKAGGRCEFRGCNHELFHDALTLQETNLANVGHIVAAEPGGPRGTDPLPLHERNRVENVMLVCLDHHEVIDSPRLANQYPVSLLREMKREHEERIAIVTAMSPDLRTTVLRCRANILNEVVGIDIEDVRTALFPRRYPADREGISVDLARTPGHDGESYYSDKAREIEQIIGRELAIREISHLSVFALGPIPLLIQLGHALSNKIPTDIYQRHRQSDSWAWPSAGTTVDFAFTKQREGSSRHRVAIVLPLSGSISVEALPVSSDTSLSIYQLSLANLQPSPLFLTRPESLENFRRRYRELLSNIQAEHGLVESIDVFPAVPAPIAVLIGRETLHKVDPILRVYDFDKKIGIFRLSLEVNKR